MAKQKPEVTSPWEDQAPIEEIRSKDTEIEEKKSWFKTGSEGFAAKKVQDTVNKLRREKNVFRFFLKPDQETPIIFVDSLGFYVAEHNIKIDGKWGNHITCVSEMDHCSVCESQGKKGTIMAYYTIIDPRSFTKHDGTVGTFTKMLFGAKGKVIDKIDDLKKRNGGDLTGLVVRAKRYDNKDYSTGSDFEKVSDTRVNIVTKFGIESAKPFDYKILLAPPTPEELAGLGFGVGVIGSVESSVDHDSLFS